MSTHRVRVGGQWVTRPRRIRRSGAWAGQDPPPSGRYRTQGTQILNPSGAVFVPRGFNVGGSTFANGGAWPDFAKDAAFASGMKAWGANAVRLIGYATDRYSWTVKSAGYQGFTGDAAADHLADELTTWWRAQGLIVMVECHDLTYRTAEPAWTSYKSQVIAFWGRYAQRWGHDSGVWFNICNEPNMDNHSEWLAFHDAACTAIRAHADNIIVVDAPGYAGDSGKKVDGTPMGWRAFSPDAGPALNAEHGNLVVGWHNYGHHNIFTTTVNVNAYVTAVHTAGLPLVAGEVGQPRNLANAGSGNGANEAAALTASCTVLPERGVGAFWWATNFNDDYALQQPTGSVNPFLPGTALSAGGAKFKACLTAY